MSNLLDYVTDVAPESVYDTPLNHIDILALTELAYLPFDELVPTGFDAEEGIRIDHLATAFFDKMGDKPIPLTLVTKERIELLKQLAASTRFKYFKVFAYVNDYDKEAEKQFSALTYALHRKEFITIFRGTDDTLIGWKEDFHMAYMEEIPAQQAAQDYLTTLMTREIGRYHIAGHSKGGNLSLFATSQLPPAFQLGILSICIFDAPGFRTEQLETPAFKRILTKVHSYLPQDSLVGMFFHTPTQAIVVKSQAYGLAQHMTFSWEIEERAFVTLDKRTRDSYQHDTTFKRWLTDLSDEQLREFIDTFFSIFIQSGIERFSDVAIDTPSKLRAIQHQLAAVSPETQDRMRDIIRHWFETRIQVWKEYQPFWDFSKKSSTKKEEEDTAV